VRHLVGALVVCLVFVVRPGIAPTPPAEGQESGDQATDDPSAAEVEQTVDETVGIAQSTQQQQDAWATERAELQVRYRDLKAQVAYLTERKTVETEQADALQADVDELVRRLEESALLDAGLEDTLFAVFQTLQDHVQADLPFLPEERGRRLQNLRGDLVRPDVQHAEKLRRLLEALFIEASYGSDFEVYPGEVLVGADSLSVDVLRLGRLSVFWQTPDGKRAGEFDRGSGTWVELDGSARHRIELAMDMAARRRSHDVIALPLGRIAP
jgi:hypothetical protein